jgi:hypothetical protein
MTSTPMPEAGTEVETRQAHQTRILELDGGVGILSEEQTNAALASSRSIHDVIEAKEAEGANDKQTTKKRRRRTLGETSIKSEDLPFEWRGMIVLRCLSTSKDFGNLLIPCRTN